MRLPGAVEDHFGYVDLGHRHAALELGAGETNLVGALQCAHILGPARPIGRGYRRCRVHVAFSPLPRISVRGNMLARLFTWTGLPWPCEAGPRMRRGWSGTSPPLLQGFGDEPRTVMQSALGKLRQGGSRGQYLSIRFVRYKRAFSLSPGLVKKWTSRGDASGAPRGARMGRSGARTVLRGRSVVVWPRQRPVHRLELALDPRE